MMNNDNILSHNTNRISILYNNNILIQWVMEIFEVEENNKEEEDLVKEKVKSYAIIVDNQDTLPEISKFRRRHVHIVNILTRMSNSGHNCSRNGWLKRWEIQTLCRIII